MMRYLHTYRVLTGIFLAFVLAGLPACAMFESKPDPQMFALQEQLRLVSKSNATTQKAIKNISGRLDGMETKVGGIENAVEETMPALQRDMQKIAISNATTQQTVEDVYVGFRAIETTVNRLENTVQELATQPGPTMSAEQAFLSEIADEPPTTTVETTTQLEVEEPVAAVEEKEKEAESANGDAQREYEEAYKAYVEHRYDEALTLFKGFLESYPEHSLADNAQYWLGEVHYDTGDYVSAILAFKDVVTHYTEDDKAPDALLKIGYAYVALDDPSNARMFLKRVIKNYPFSSAEAKARAKLKELEDQ
jgi:tol-pal system protein YbgF